MALPRVFLLLVILSACAPLHAQIRRCTAADGSVIYTDRRCQDLGATESASPPAGPRLGARLYRNGCSRNLQDLVYEVTSAIDNKDPNRIAGVYHWVGMSTSTAYAVMGRLSTIAQRPLVDVIPVASGENDYYPQTTVRRIPVALRVEQTLANGSTPSTTVFGLRRYLGCWWITL